MASPNANVVDETQTLQASQFEYKTEVQGGEIHGGSSGKPWSMYHTETKKLDKEMVERWKGEAESALIFAGLFSAVVAVGLVISVSWLSPNTDGQPSKLSTTVILVNVTWFGSIVLCMASSVFATLIQHWARRYLELTQGCGAPHERARLRMFMSNGLKRFHMDRLLLVLPMSLHTSILLYSVGIAVFVLSILSDRNMGFFAIGYVLYFYLAYATATVLPLFFFDSPYTTPFSAMTWRLTHVFLFGVFSTIRGIVDLLSHALSAMLPSTYQQVCKYRGAQWRGMLDKRVNKHRQWFLDGLQRSVELHVTEAPQVVDANALEWTLTSIVENDSDKEVENFAACVPGFLDPYVQSRNSEAILSFMSDQPPTDPIFGFRLHHLLKKCLLGTSTLTEEERKRRLRVCIKCLWCWVKAYNQIPESLPPYFPLLSPDLTRRLQTEQDSTASMIGRCFGALVTRKLAAGVNSPHSSCVVRDAKLEYLSAALGSTSKEVETFLSQTGAIGLANIVSLTSGALVTEWVPWEVLDVFRATIDILLTEDFLTSLNTELPPDLVAKFYETHSNAKRLQIPDWLMVQLKRISEQLFVINDAQPAGDVPLGVV